MFISELLGLKVPPQFSDPPKMLRFVTNYTLNRKFRPPHLLGPQYCYPRIDTDNTYLTTTVIFIIVMTRFLKNVPNYTLQVFRTTNLKYIDILISKNHALYILYYV